KALRLEELEEPHGRDVGKALERLGEEALVLIEDARASSLRPGELRSHARAVACLFVLLKHSFHSLSRHAEHRCDRAHRGAAEVEPDDLVTRLLVHGRARKSLMASLIWRASRPSFSRSGE